LPDVESRTVSKLSCSIGQIFRFTEVLAKTTHSSPGTEQSPSNYWSIYTLHRD